MSQERERRAVNRRDLLFGRFAEAEERRFDSLVLVFLRGGCDVLNLLCPLLPEDRKAYEEARPNLQLETSSLLALDGRFGLHPSAGGLKKLWDAKKLAVVPAAGMKSHNRSHFDAQTFIELGTPDKKGTPTGWLARHLAGGPTVTGHPLRAVAAGPLAPISLLGCMDCTAIQDIEKFGRLGGNADALPEMIATMKRMSQSSDIVSEKTRSSLLAIESLNRISATEPSGPANVEYPKSDVGRRLQTIARLIKQNLPVEIATVDMGGWDTHRNQGKGEDGTFARQVLNLSGSLQAFLRDLATGEPNEPAKRTTVVVMTEFGRRLRENANRGTDHGHGGAMLILGDNVNGGRTYGEWPGLKTDQLYERADLQAATDFRRPLAEILRKRRGEKRLAEVFPGYSPESDLGLAKG